MTRGLALVLGLGRFGGGREASRWLLNQGWQLRISDRASSESLAEPIAALESENGEIDWRLGDPSDDLLEDVDLLVVNPAIPDGHPIIEKAHQLKVPMTQEINLFLEAFPGRVVFVTGTNGKSTTATLLAAAIQESNMDCLLGGNLGRSLLADAARWNQDTLAVIEISSFQLDRIDPARHSVVGTVFTRVTQDHLDRHGTLPAYQAAKGRAAEAATEWIVHARDDGVAASFRTAAPRRVTYGLSDPTDGHVGTRSGSLWSCLSDAGPILPIEDLPLIGTFQQENALAAFAAARLLGADHRRAAMAIARQESLPHRLQRLEPIAGVQIFDNGVSTEWRSTLSAMQSLDGPIRWIGGGKSKGGDLAAIADALADHLHSAHLFGASAGPLGHILQSRLPTTIHEHLHDAVSTAWEASRADDQLLFSPAFASYDQYPNFAARAGDFLDQVEQLRRSTASTRASQTTDLRAGFGPGVTER